MANIKTFNRLFVCSLAILFALAADHSLIVFAEDMVDIATRVQQQQPSREGTLRSGDTAPDLETSPEELAYDAATIIGDHLALEGFRRFGLPVADERIQKYANLVGHALVRNSRQPDMPFYFVITDSPIYSAFGCSGGIVFMTSALFRSLGDEAELASVLAREIAHIERKHLLRLAANSGLAKDAPFEQLMAYLYDRLFEKGLDPEMEYEADRLAVDLTSRTGYDPWGLVRVLTRLKEKQGMTGGWFATHPSQDLRIQRVHSALSTIPVENDYARVAHRFSTYREMISMDSSPKAQEESSVIPSNEKTDSVMEGANDATGSGTKE